MRAAYKFDNIFVLEKVDKQMYKDNYYKTLFLLKHNTNAITHKHAHILTSMTAQMYRLQSEQIDLEIIDGPGTEN